MKNILLLVMLILTATNLTIKAQNEKNISAESNRNNNNSISPLKDILLPDGTINLLSNIKGNFDVSGYKMTYDNKGLPVFIPESISLINNNENWSNEFPGSFGVNGNVNALAMDASGYIYIAGSFTTAYGTTANRIAKWDGTVWSALGSGMDNNISAIAIDRNGILYAGGSFTTAGGVSASKIAKWDGTEWSALNTGMNNTINTLAIDVTGNVYAGGSFTTAGGVLVNKIAKWDGTTWSSLGTGLNNSVFSIIIDDNGIVYASGIFTTAGSVTANRIAKWDGTSWSALGTGMNSTVNILAVDLSGNIYAGGGFTTAGSISANKIAKWDGTTWSALGTGMNSSVISIKIDNNGLVYAGGFFTTAGGASTSKIAKWNGTSWSELGTGLNNTVNTILINDSNNIYVGGIFTTAGGISASKIAKWDDIAWSALGTEINSGMDNIINTIAIDSIGNVYVGGAFLTSGIITSNYIAKWNGISWSSFGTGMNGIVNSIAVDRFGNVFAGGQFTIAGGVSANYIAMWNGETWSALGTGLDASVNALIVDNNGNVYAGGDFSIAGNNFSNYIAKWDGTSWSPLGTGINGPVYSLAFDNNWNIYTGGEFSMINELSANNIAKWNGLEWSTLGTGMDARVNTLVVDDSSYVYAGGSFSTAGSVFVNNIAKWNGITWSLLGTGMGNTVNALAVDASGNLFAGGAFTTAGGISANRIAKWDGTTWLNLGSGTNGIINAVKIYNNYIYCGGNFQFAGDKNSAYFGKFTYPEINIKGNNLSITDGDNTPDLGDHTDFSTITIGTPVTRTFTIENIGEVLLNLTNTVRVIVTGRGYSLTNDAPLTINSNDSATFQVSFTPDSCGLFLGNVSIANDDLNENPYNFVISGTGIDNIPPVTPTLNDISAECSVLSIIAPTTTDNCVSIVTGTTSQVFPIMEQGTTVVTWLFEDDNENITTQTQNVFIEDITNPIPDVASLPDLSDECSITPTAPTATDNCTGNISGVTVTSLPISTQGTTIITWHYDDGNGNITTQTQNVFIEDITNPIPDLSSLPDLSDECSITATAPTATDNCAGIITGITTDPQTYTSQGNFIITWNYDDGNGNTSTQLQNVIIDDISSPVPDVTNLPDLTSECSATATSPTATDNCTGVITGTTTDQLTYSTQGNYSIIWNYDDGNGNTSTQQQNVIIDDISGPVPNATTLPDLTGECSATATSPTATDNCTGVITGTTTDQLTYSIQGNYSIIWNYDDGNGNTTTQNQNVIIDDVTNPVPDFTTLPDLTGECSVYATVPSATDNCAGIITATTNTTFPVTSQGTTVLAWMFDDGNGNVITQNQNVIIDDVTNPVPDFTTLPDLTGECSVYATVPSATDNCAGIITATTNTIFPVTSQGTTEIIWTYDDGNGNSITQTQNVFIEDLTNPIPDVTSLPDLSGECSVTLTAPTASDNCSVGIIGTTSSISPVTEYGTTVVLWTFDDGNGNVATSTQNIIITGISSTLYETVCEKFTLNDITYYSSGTYTQMLTNAAGCDSIITLYLTVNYSTNNTLNETACENYTLNGTTYYSSGSYIQILTNQIGCDSIITLNLTINNATTSTITETACDSYIFNGITYNASGEYTQILENAEGCDSIITLKLTINNGSSSLTSVIACGSYKWTDEIDYTSSGIYYQYLENIFGCDSIATLDLNLHSLISVYLGVDDTLCSNRQDIKILDAGNEGMSYLWNDGSQLQTLTVYSESMVIGNYFYSVTVTDEVCIGSDEIELIVDVCTGIDNFESVFDVKVYPNPNRNGIFTIETIGNDGNTNNIDIYDIRGRKIFSNNTDDNNYKIDISKLGTGIYTLVINAGKNYVKKRIINSK